MYNLTKATFHLDSIFRGPTHQTAKKKVIRHVSDDLNIL